MPLGSQHPDNNLWHYIGLRPARTPTINTLRLHSPLIPVNFSYIERKLGKDGLAKWTKIWGPSEGQKFAKVVDRKKGAPQRGSLPRLSMTENRESFSVEDSHFSGYIDLWGESLVQLPTLMYPQQKMTKEFFGQFLLF